jgi:hypothetical protein
MSRNEWEAGKVYIPSHSWSNIKKALQNAQNSEREIVLAKATKLQEEVVRNFKGQKSIDPQDVKDYLWHTAKEENKTAIYLVSKSLKGTGYQMKKITNKMLDEVFPKATNRTVHYGDLIECSVTIDNEKKCIHWHVGENNHAVDDARNSWLGRVLFKELGKIDYGQSKKLGGYFVGNDEINRDDGDGTNYITASFGKKGEWQESFY